ncbi:MAG: DUF749 family protein [Candidatus Hydrothermarchaeota archaeon]|nr:DUF749 family protein [Candidatus Hydrothermarchaeota archaeon]
MSKLIASLVDVKRADKIHVELQPYLEFKANYENRSLRGDEMVAIFNIVSTSSYLPVFLDSWKTMEEIEEEIAVHGFAKLNPASRAALSKYLE